MPNDKNENLLAAEVIPASYRLATRMSRIEKSPFLTIMRAAKAVQDEGREVTFLSMGEPDFETPDHIKAAGVTAIESGNTRYTSMDGTTEIKSAIIEKMMRDSDLHYTADQITVTAGGTQAIFNGMFATVEQGDEVILPTPCYPPYVSAIKLVGATPVIISTREEDGFKLRAEDLSAAITDKTRWIILNSPSNPAGVVIEEDELLALANILRQHPSIMIWSDDIYESIIFDKPFRNIINIAPDLYDRTVILNGVSKSYAMTGWRIGYLCGPSFIINAVSQVAASQTFAPSTISQAAVVTALLGPQDLVIQQCKEYERRKNLVCARLREIPNITFVEPKGAFYAFVGIKAFIGLRTPNGKIIKSDLDFVLYVLESQALALVQGSAFGTEGYVRISTAASEEVLSCALDKFAKACAAIK